MRRLLLTIWLLIAGLTTQAQLYSNDFENQHTWYPPWTNLHIAADSTAAEGLYVSICDSIIEYGLGFVIEADKLYPHQNVHVRYEFLLKTGRPETKAEFVVSIDGPDGNRYWHAYPLSTFVNDTLLWAPVTFNLDFPRDYLDNGKINAYIWNRERESLAFDNASLSITPMTMPSYLPRHDTLIGPMGLLTEYILENDTITDYQPFTETDDGRWMVENELLSTALSIDSIQLSFDYQLSTTFHRQGELLRLALVVPFADSMLTVYRRNMTVDSVVFQPEYYLDREGFKIGEGDHTMVSYHQTDISSTQLDAVNRIAYFNLDYWRDHPLIHYPLNDTVRDVFEDVSCRHVDAGMQWHHVVTLYEGDDVKNLPRIMQVPYGYEAGIIFTEHADWTDIRTHRAVLFGSETITKARNATGGFVGYGIPVTKSIFYNNPDQVTNEAISHGAFKGLHATLKTDREFENLINQLYNIGFDICLHTPEQHTTTPDNLKEALADMRRRYQSTTWIDHGYNNGLSNNREDMVCDGLLPDSPYYAAELWKKNGIRYLWNAYYEENRMEQWHFDCNLMQPYPGFGDALPNRQVSQQQVFTCWCTPSTLEAVTDSDWDFYYSNERLQRLIDNHDVHITHIYPAWVWPGRTFWTYDADSTIVALPGMNRAFERIAALRDAHKLLPMTIKTYLDYYTRLLQVRYEILDGEHIRLYNDGDAIKGFTLLCPSPIRFEDNRWYDYRKSRDYYYIWFDLKSNDQITLKIVNQ